MVPELGTVQIFVAKAEESLAGRGRKQMRTEHDLNLDRPMERAIEQLKAAITEQYPQAAFVIVRGEDPEGIYLKTIVDLEDVDQVVDSILDKLYELQVERALPIYVVPLQPIDRVLKELSRPRQRSRPRIDWQALPSPARP